MEFGRDGKGRGVTFDIPAYRVSLPWGKSMVRRALIAVLAFDRKLVLNSGPVEALPDLDRALAEAKTAPGDVSDVIFTASFPWNIGNGPILQRRNPDTGFYAHPRVLEYIGNTARQEEERPYFGFYKLVAGNTRDVAPLNDGEEIDLGGETAEIHFVHGVVEDTVAIRLKKRKLLILDGSVLEATPGTDTHTGWLARKSLSALAKLQWTHLLTAPYGLVEREKRDLVAERIVASNASEIRYMKAG